MNISELLKILCCPETHQALRVAEPAVIEGLNRQIAAGTLKKRDGQIVTERLDRGLVREDGAVLYPIRNNIPIMLIDESLPLEIQNPKGK